MHTSFTGNSRKSRQINLSGRNALNPWAAISGTQKGPATASGPQNTIAHAQAERVKRQQERERLIAARTLQKSWRGYASRRDIKQKWRTEWDDFEQRRTGTFERLDYGAAVFATPSTIRRYQAAGELHQQLRILIRFLSISDHMDQMRLLYFGDVLKATLLEPLDADSLLRVQLKKLGVLISRLILGYATPLSGLAGPDLLLNHHGLLLSKSLEQLNFMEILIPEEMCGNAFWIYNALGHLSQSTQPLPDDIQKLIARAASWLLRQSNAHVLTAYLAFATKFLTVTNLSAQSIVLPYVSIQLDQNTLAKAIVGSFDSSDGRPNYDLMQADKQLILLGHLIYLRDTMLGTNDITAPVGQDQNIDAISLLLGLRADDIALSIDQFVESTGGHTSLLPIPDFTRTQINSLSRSKSMDSILSYISTCQLPIAETARILANYALNLIRAFPSRAYDIRTRIYLNSVRLKSQGRFNSVQYFWQASQSTELFRRMVQSQRNVLPLLKPQKSQSEQIGRSGVLKRDGKGWREDWRVLLFFFELYTSALKLMDDEEFFSLDESKTIGVTDEDIQSSFGPLPPGEISRMVTFLKNLAFTLYWHAEDLDLSDAMADKESLSAYFGTSVPDSEPRAHIMQTRSGLPGLEDVSQTYLKGLTTGVLRMLHERDSRRRFLPDGHWLMTNEVDMAGFIPAVVAEEEKRHQLGDEGEEEDEEFEDILNDDDTSAPSPAFWLGAGPASRGSRQTAMFNAYMRKQEQARKRRQVASLAPRLEILRNLPFFIPFATRVKIFREFVHNDQYRRRLGCVDPYEWRYAFIRTQIRPGISGEDLLAPHQAEVRRGRVFDDAYDQFYKLGEGLKEPIYIKFIDRFGREEPGLDGGGLQKEFLTDATSEAFAASDDWSLFVENEQHLIYPNPNLYEMAAEANRMVGFKPNTEEWNVPMRDLLQRFEFLGRIFGKCIYEGFLVDIQFAPFFLLKWALTGGTTSASNETGYRATINDVRDLDPELYRGLLKLKNYPGNVEADFSLNFTVTDTMEVSDDPEKHTPHTVTRELIHNGANVPVTNQNRLAYIDRMVRYRLQRQPQVVTNAFLKGLGQMIQPMWLAMFNQKELQSLIGGDNSELDLADLRRHTETQGLYQVGDDGIDHPTIELFWTALRKMSDPDRRKVLKFVTSTPRAPLLGFSNLKPRFAIRDAGKDEHGREKAEKYLPTASTCFNQLKLPRYESEHVMTERLLYAANAEAGFENS